MGSFCLVATIAFVYYKCASRISLVSVSAELLSTANVHLHANPKYEDKEADKSSHHGAYRNPNQATNSGNLLSELVRPNRQQQTIEVPHSISINFNRHSVHSKPTFTRHDSLTCNAGSEREMKALQTSPSVGAEFGFFSFPMNDCPEPPTMFNTFSRVNHQTLRQIDPSLEVDRSSIQYKSDLGTGDFGQVFHAEVTDKNNPEKKMEVAVKMLKDARSLETERSFQYEAQLLANFSHPNIVKLRGVCSKGQPFCILMDYMKYGDLRKYLASCSGGGSSDGTKRQLTPTDLLMISQQVASGNSLTYSFGK